MGRKAIDLTGQKFGRLTAIKQNGVNSSGNALWLCECECGKRYITESYHLRKGLTVSCGCFKKDNPPCLKHGETKTRLYNIWHGIKRRCCAKTDKAYPKYGGRGIKICDRWKNSYETFRDDVSKLPHFGEKGYSLDRINNDGNYEPNNVRWATRKEQQNNTRKNRYITYKGKTQTLKQWAEELKINYQTLYTRVYESHWNIEKAFNTP